MSGSQDPDLGSAEGDEGKQNYILWSVCVFNLEETAPQSQELQASGN